MAGSHPLPLRAGAALPPCGQVDPTRSRRDFLHRAGCGFGSLALSSLLARDAAAAAPLTGPFAARPPHFAPRAKSVIWIFIDGGPSHIDLFDPKPELNRLAGKPLPESFPRPLTAMGVTANTPLLGSPRVFRQHGESGIWLSDWLPHLSRHADKLAVIRSCVADGLNHVGGVCQMNTGSILGGRPCVGSWATYGLGTENQDLPAYVVLLDSPSEPPGGNRNWGTGFMPATFQGTKLRSEGSPILYLQPPGARSTIEQRRELDFVQTLNRRHQQSRAGEDLLDARIASYELAYRMQAAAPEAVDLSQETARTLSDYGLDQKETAAMGRNCLLARRLVERGVRYVQLYSGAGSQWDAHRDVEGNHSRHCRESDQPVAALLQDLAQRGLLDETLVVWAGEFGRTPMSESGDGRDHNPYGFSIWMAGGGIRGGTTYGATDEIGLYAIEGKAHIHDIHATVLHLLGLDQQALTYLHNGRDERLTIVAGQVIEGVLS